MSFCWRHMGIKKFKSGRLTRRQYDQKKVSHCIKENPSFIEEIISQAFGSPDAQVNLYYAFEGLRKKQNFLDLGVARYLVGNGIIRSINSLGKNNNFAQALYTLTKKGMKLLIPKKDNK